MTDHTHCQCDNCSGVDCGQDDPEAYKKAQEERDEAIRKGEREKIMEEMIKLSEMIETNETERWRDLGRSKNDPYINGSHSGYGHALRDLRQWIDNIKFAERFTTPLGVVGDRGAEGARGGGPEDMEEK